MIKDKFKIDIDTAYVEGSDMEKYAIMIYISNYECNEFTAFNTANKEYDPEILRFVFDSDDEGYFLTSISYINPYRDDMYNFTFDKPDEIYDIIQNMITKVNRKVKGTYVYDIDTIVKYLENYTEDMYITLHSRYDESNKYKDAKIILKYDNKFLSLNLDDIVLVTANLRHDNTLVVTENTNYMTLKVHEDDVYLLDAAFVTFYKNARKYLRHRCDLKDLDKSLFEKPIRLEKEL